MVVGFRRLIGVLLRGEEATLPQELQEGPGIIAEGGRRSQADGRLPLLLESGALQDQMERILGGPRCRRWSSHRREVQVVFSTMRQTKCHQPPFSPGETTIKGSWSKIPLL